jgi:hypothetical protein
MFGPSIGRNCISCSAAKPVIRPAAATELGLWVSSSVTLLAYNSGICLTISGCEQTLFTILLPDRAACGEVAELVSE